MKSGVKIAYGTDIGEGDHTMEFALMIAGGLTPIKALFAATRDAADLIGAADRIGSVQSGRYADLVATSGNPLADPTQLGHVDFVMKGGIVYRQDGHPTVAGIE
jgi:imidazolonepropionase-like amidohydrolase